MGLGAAASPATACLQAFLETYRVTAPSLPFLPKRRLLPLLAGGDYFYFQLVTLTKEKGRPLVFRTAGLPLTLHLCGALSYAALVHRHLPGLPGGLVSTLLFMFYCLSLGSAASC